METDQLFEDIIELPDAEAKERFERLVGVDEIKNCLVKEARILLNPELLEEWSKKYHKKVIPIIRTFQDRASLFIFAGDIGTGKTSLAETFGDSVARQENISVTLFRLSLNTRGRGAVGEMTRLISSAFDKVREVASERSSPGKKPSSAVILVIDEADALAQSRELDQMHHEDRAGVNAVIRGIDSLTPSHLPVLIVMCTNRLSAIDPAVMRRSATIFEFNRPNDEQRMEILRRELAETNITDEELAQLAKEMGAKDGKEYGFTYSDIINKFLPALLLEAFPDKPITFDAAKQILERLSPTPPFKDNHANK